MSELDQWVVVLMDPKACDELKKRALDYTSCVKLDPSFISFALEKTLELNLDHPQATSLAFFYLESARELLMRDYASYTDRQRKECYAFIEKLSENRTRSLQSETSLRNKLAGIYAIIVGKELERDTLSPFESLLRTAEIHTNRLLVVSVLQRFYEDFLDEGDGQMMERMKMYVDKELIPRLSELFMYFLTDTDPNLIQSTLSLIGYYMDFLPIEMIISCIPFFIQYRTIAKRESLIFMRKLVGKDMDLERKGEVISMSGVVPWLESLEFDTSLGSINPELTEAALLVNDLGLYQCSISPISCPSVFPLSLRFLHSPDPSLSSLTLDFLRAFTLSTPDIPSPSLSILCEGLLYHCHLPCGIESSDELIPAYKLRKVYVEVFAAVSATNSEFSLKMLSEFMQKSLETDKKPEDIEAILYLFCQFADSIGDLNDLLASDNPLSSFLTYLFMSNISEFPYKTVRKAFLSTCVRYSLFFLQPTRSLFVSRLIPLLTVWVGEADLCSGACCLIAKLTNPMHVAVAPHIPALLTHLLSRLNLPFDDPSTSHIAKSISGIVSQCGDNPSMQRTALQQFLASLPSPASPATFDRISDVISSFRLKNSSELHRELVSFSDFILHELHSQVISPLLYQSTIHFYETLVSALGEKAQKCIWDVLQILFPSTNIDTLSDLLVFVKFLSELYEFPCVFPPEILSGLTTRFIKTIPRPDDCNSPVFPRYVSMRKAWISLMTILESRKIDLFAISEEYTLIAYITEVCDNSAEMMTIGEAIDLLAVIAENRLNAIELSPGLDLIISRCAAITSFVLSTCFLETLPPLYQLSRLHLAAFQLCERFKLAEMFISVLRGCIPEGVVGEYISLMGSTGRHGEDRKEGIQRMSWILRTEGAQ